MAARSVGSGTLSFGCLAIPFKTYTATSRKQVRFNMLHKTCGSRLKGSPGMALCPVDNVIVQRADMIRGFEYARDEYARFTAEELRALEEDRSGHLEIAEVVSDDAVSFLFVAKTEFIGPERGAERAYRLFALALERNRKVAIGRLIRRGRSKLVIIRPYAGRLVLQECFFADEVRSFDDVVASKHPFEFKPMEVDLADRLLKSLERDTFEPGRFRDEWADRVREAVEKKVAGEEIIAQPESPNAQIIDLLEWLKRSVSAAEAAANTTATPAREAETPVLEDARGRVPRKRRKPVKRKY